MMSLKTELYDHQKQAFNKLKKIKVGALYMEMGTGKTRAALELINLRLSKGKVNHILWLCPCSVKKSLERDLLKHCEDISNITICGIETLSSSIRTNVELLKLVKSKRVYLIVDESNLVKNHRAKRTENIIRLSEFSDYKLILNGTPISKNEKDLYSQWYILDWRIFGYRSFWSFAANHLEYSEIVPGKIVRVLNVDYLVSKMAPYSYQIKKEECLDLPDKSYSTYYCQLTDEQKEHYGQVASDLMFELDELEPYTIYRLFTGLQNVISGFEVWQEDDTLTKKPFFKNSADNPRMQTLLDIIHSLDEKAIIFCKYTSEIKDITKNLNEEYGDGTAVEFYGKLNQKQRQENLKRFEDSAQFLVANKVCAGYGLNLQFCSYVIYYSNDWDYATRIQSEDRVHRIGQKKNVHYVDICAEETLDERILDCLERKENLIESFKDELENQKDTSVVERYIYYKKNGKLRLSRSEKVEVKALNELREVR